MSSTKKDTIAALRMLRARLLAQLDDLDDLGDLHAALYSSTNGDVDVAIEDATAALLEAARVVAVAAHRKVGER